VGHRANKIAESVPKTVTLHNAGVVEGGSEKISQIIIMAPANVPIAVCPMQQLTGTLVADCRQL